MGAQGVCVGQFNDVHKVLDSAPANVMFFCTKCEPKVKLALKFFTDIQRTQQVLNEKLKQLKEKFSKSASDIATCSIGSTNKYLCKERNGIERKWVCIYKQNSSTIRYH